MAKPTVAVIGASKDRSKFGNKAVLAHAQNGWEVFPVHPAEPEIEGFKAFRSVLDIPVPIDRVTLYLPPKLGLAALDDIAKKGCRELYINPGAESPEIAAKARSLGLKSIQACSIIAAGNRP